MNCKGNNYPSRNCTCSAAEESYTVIEGPAGPQGIQGPRGETGPQGPQGIKGDMGCQGPAGPRGLAGLQGPRGTQGVRGDIGPKGDPGCMGPQGIQGNPGPIGPQGDRGPVGPKGDQGPLGPIGQKGDRGDPGERGVQGEQGPQGEQGIPGETGPQGPQGDKGCIGPQGEQGPMGPAGIQGEKGEIGPKGETGPQGPQGETPTVTIGSVSSGDAAIVTETDTETGISLDFVLPIGPQGPQGETGGTGELGPQGEKGETGAQGPQGETGPAPDITVSESTPTSYKITFKTDTQEITSPNLKSNPECYNIDLSATGSSKDIPIGKLILTYQNTSSTSIRFSVRAADAAVPILADIRRTSIYDGSSIETQTNNNATISGRLVIDDLIYSMSQEMHWTRIRQQDPVSGLWSMCEVRTFASQGGARTSVCVEWFYNNASFQTP